MRDVHVITPGDHFSPLTGSAIPTVVHGLATHRPPEVPRPSVAVARGTNPVRYDSADIVEYDPIVPARLPRGLRPTKVDALAARLGSPRPFARRTLGAVVREQDSWPPSRVFAHNSPQLVPLTDSNRHRAYLYAHNNVLKTYRQREAGKSLDAAAGIICVSHYLAERISAQLPQRLRGRVRVVHNGVDAQFFRRLEPLRHSGTLRIVYVGRMIPEKGPDVLLEALRLLDRSDIHATLIGSRGFDAADPLTAYERTVRTLATGLRETVTLTSFLPREAVRDAMGRADVVVVPSRWPEPFALTVLEGMAAGAAVVGSHVGGIPETLTGVGMLVPPDDPEALAERLEALADDDAQLRTSAAAGRVYAEQHDWGYAARILATVTEELG